MKRLLLLMAGLGGCGSGPMVAVVPVFAERGAESISVAGTVEAIQLQNINKARGHFTYNVEVRIAHDGVRESPHDADHEPGEFRVRVHKVYWSELDAAEQAALAPSGPQSTMTLERWREYVVGDQVTLDVSPWGPGFGARRFPAPEPTTSSGR